MVRVRARAILEQMSKDIPTGSEAGEPDEGSGGTSERREFGPYWLLKELGRGAQGVVFLAEDKSLRRKVALKMLTGAGAQSQNVRDRFRREAELTSRFEHPGICGVHDLGEVDGRPYIAMQYVRGTTLAALIEKAQAGSSLPGPAPGPGTKDPACCEHAEDVAETQARGLRGGLRYAFGDLFDEVGTYLLPALLLSALLTSVVDPGGLARYFTSTWVQMLVLLVAGIPIYVCATAATPVAAALIAGGFSPGAALVFLLAGPATNLVTIAAAAQMLGRRGAMLYVAAVAIGALASGVALDALFAGFGIEPRAAATPAHEHHGVLAWTSAAVLSALIGRVYWRKVRGRR